MTRRRSTEGPSQRWNARQSAAALFVGAALGGAGGVAPAQDRASAALDDVPPGCGSLIRADKPVEPETGGCFEDRIQLLLADDVAVVTRDRRRLVVSLVALYRVEEKNAFSRSFASQSAGRAHLRAMLVSRLRQAFSDTSVEDLLAASNERRVGAARADVAQQATSFGVDLVDLRLGGVDLPMANLEATLARMRAERQRESARIRAEAEQQALRREAAAHREAQQILAEARAAAAQRVAEAVAQRAKITGAAYALDPDFFAAYRATRAAEPDQKRRAPPVE